MTTITEAATSTAEPFDDELPQGLGWALRDSWNEAMRHIRALPRNVDALVAYMQSLK